MSCCLTTIILALISRVGIVLWWLDNPNARALAFQNWVLRGWLWTLIHPMVLLASWVFVFKICLRVPPAAVRGEAQPADEAQRQQIIQVLIARIGDIPRAMGMHVEEGAVAGGQKVADPAVGGVPGDGIEAIRLEAQETEAVYLHVEVFRAHRRMNRHQCRRARVAARFGGYKPIGTLEIARWRERKGKAEPMDLPAGHQLRVARIEPLPVGQGKLPPDQLVVRALFLSPADIELPTVHVGMNVEHLPGNEPVQFLGPDAAVQIVIGQRKL